MCLYTKCDTIDKQSDKQLVKRREKEIQNSYFIISNKKHKIFIGLYCFVTVLFSWTLFNIIKRTNVNIAVIMKMGNKENNKYNYC